FGRGEAQFCGKVVAVDVDVGDGERRYGPGVAVDGGAAARPLVGLVAQDLLVQRVVVGEAGGEQMRLVDVHLDDVGAAAAFDRGGDARRHVVLVDLLHRHLDPGGLGELRGLAIDLLVGGGDEAGPLQV